MKMLAACSPAHPHGPFRPFLVRNALGNLQVRTLDPDGIHHTDVQYIVATECDQRAGLKAKKGTR